MLEEMIGKLNSLKKTYIFVLHIYFALTRIDLLFAYKPSSLKVILYGTQEYRVVL